MAIIKFIQKTRLVPYYLLLHYFLLFTSFILINNFLQLKKLNKKGNINWILIIILIAFVLYIVGKTQSWW